MSWQIAPGKKYRLEFGTISIPFQVVEEPSAPNDEQTPTPPTEGEAADVYNRLLLEDVKDNAFRYGHAHYEAARDSTDKDFRLAWTYYDAIAVYRALYQWYGAEWMREAELLAVDIFRDEYVVPNEGKLPAKFVFTRGLTQRAVGEHEAESAAAVQLIATNSAYCHEGNRMDGRTEGFAMAREVAYSAAAMLDAHQLSGFVHPLLLDYLHQSVRHLQEVLTDKVPTYEPFMAALACRTLILYDLSGQDVFPSSFPKSNIAPLIDSVAAKLWADAWIPNAEGHPWGAFAYTARAPEPQPAPDLNMLLVPIWGYLHHVTGGEDAYLLRGDQIWRGGVNGAYLGNAKQFNQQFFWGLDYLKLGYSEFLGTWEV